MSSRKKEYDDFKIFLKANIRSKRYDNTVDNGIDLRDDEFKAERSIFRKENYVHKNGDTTNIYKMDIEMTYCDFSRYNIMNNKDKEWKRYARNKKSPNVPRLYYAYLQQGEHFWLRTLLLRKKGCTPYEDIRTYEGTTYATFYETCKAMDLLKDDEEYFRCMREAIATHSPNQLIGMFVIISDDRCGIIAWSFFHFEVYQCLQHLKNK